MSRTPRNNETHEEPWWLEQGADWCHFCEASFHPEALYYCVACDRAVCMLCVVQGPDKRDIRCPECGCKPEDGGPS